MREYPVVLTGSGCLTARGDWTLHGASANIFEEREYSSDENAPERIEGFDFKHYLASQKTYLDRASALALAGCALALRDANLAFPVNHSDEFGITLGTRFGGLDSMKTFYDGLTEKGARGASPLIFSHSYFNSPISLCAIEFALGGYHTTFCSGDDSGFQALEAAFDAIALGHACAMLCGAIETNSVAARVLGAPVRDEAAAFFVLENSREANARGACGLPFNEQVLANAKTNESFSCYGAARGVLCVAQSFAAQKSL
jgi:3-oxoacyl-(acyl-carrier-protein) synthase